MKIIKTLYIGILLPLLSFAQEKSPEIFKDIPPPHVELVIPQNKKNVVSQEQLKEIVTLHNLIGKELTKKCFNNVKEQVCLDEIASYFNTEVEDDLKFIIIKEGEKFLVPEVTYRINIYLDKNNKIKSMKKI